MLSSRQILIGLSIKYQGDWKKIYEAIQNRDTENIEEYYKKYENSQFSAVTIIDKDYPPVLKEIFSPPIVLFYYGDISLLKDASKCISVVGSRNPSKYGEEITRKIVHGLAKKYIIVSGMAAGIDGVAHRCALENKGKTVAVLGSGIDHCYPEQNRDLYNKLKDENLIISEYFGDTSPDKEHFPLRNRIIAGSSVATLITEAKKQSGSSITATYALNFGRTIFAVPSNADTNSSCNRLIKEGAILVETAQDIIEELDLTPFSETRNQENLK